MNLVQRINIKLLGADLCNDIVFSLMNWVTQRLDDGSRNVIVWIRHKNEGVQVPLSDSFVWVLVLCMSSVKVIVSNIEVKQVKTNKHHL